MKAISVSAELTVIQRAFEGAALLVKVGRQGGVEGEVAGAVASAVLALTACRFRALSWPLLGAPRHVHLEGLLASKGAGAAAC